MPVRSLAALLLLLPQPGLLGQSLRLSSATASPGEPVEIKISLKSPRGREPSTLQWERTIPLDRVIPLEEEAPGPAARKAHKSVSCALKVKTGMAYTSACIAYGGQEPIPNGVLSVLRLRISPDAKPGSFRIRIGQALAVFKDLERVPLEAAEAVITVRAARD